MPQFTTKPYTADNIHVPTLLFLLDIFAKRRLVSRVLTFVERPIPLIGRFALRRFEGRHD